MRNIIAKVIFISVLTALFFSCESSTSTNNNDAAEVLPKELAKGLELLESNCFACHSPKGSIENRVAPPMIAIKRHYIGKTTSKEEFTNDLLSFLNNPNEETSKMPGAVNKFGLMPKMGFSESDIKSIANYMYEADLEKPDWFEKHYQEESKKHVQSNDEIPPIEQGKKLAVQTKGVLGKNLLNAINTKGTEGALAFCSTKAIHLTDSMATELNAHIKRVSDKNRNPNNAANETELSYILNAKELLAAGNEIKPQLTKHENKYIGYYPIMTNQMCMQCHGEVETQIKSNTLAKIKDIYPNDKAFNYKENELRGIWVVEFEDK